MRATIAAHLALLALLPAAARAQEAPIDLTCRLAILCPDTGACRDWDQSIRITEATGGWRVVWSDELPSDYELVADLPAPDDAVDPVRVRSLLFRNTRTQATQLVSFDSAGRVVVTGHQPQAGTRVVTGIGTCEAAQ